MNLKNKLLRSMKSTHFKSNKLKKNKNKESKYKKNLWHSRQSISK